jgi:PTS system cellobiose-specific IIC component
MPEGVPPAVGSSFEALLPCLVIVIVFWLGAVVLHINIHALFSKIFEPIKYVAATLPGVILIVVLITLLWSAGIHGVSVIGTLVRPMWLAMLESNATAVANGQAMPFIAVEPFYQWFVWVGGSGGTLALVLVSIVWARSSYLKKLSRACLAPSIFNINEPVIFGYPIMLNPFFTIPFIIGPVIVVVLSYSAMKLGLVNVPYMLAPWTLPAPIGAFMATGDWRAIILSVINMVILGIVYLPFLKAYDNKMLADEGAARPA